MTDKPKVAKRQVIASREKIKWSKSGVSSVGGSTRDNFSAPSTFQDIYGSIRTISPVPLNRIITHKSEVSIGYQSILAGHTPHASEKGSSVGVTSENTQSNHAWESFLSSIHSSKYFTPASVEIPVPSSSQIRTETSYAFINDIPTPKPSLDRKSSGASSYPTPISLPDRSSPPLIGTDIPVLDFYDDDSAEDIARLAQGLGQIADELRNDREATPIPKKSGSHLRSSAKRGREDHEQPKLLKQPKLKDWDYAALAKKLEMEEIKPSDSVSNIYRSSASSIYEPSEDENAQAEDEHPSEDEDATLPQFHQRLLDSISEEGSPPAASGTGTTHTISLLPDLDLFRRRLSISSNQTAMRIECALVDSAVDVLNRAVQSAGGTSWNLLNAKAKETVEKQAIRSARTKICDTLLSNGFPAAQAAYLEAQLMVFSDLKTEMKKQLMDEAESRGKLLEDYQYPREGEAEVAEE